MRYVFCDSRITPEIENNLERYGFTALRLPPLERLASPVAAHPDMLLFIHGDRLICEKGYYSVPENRRIIDSAGLHVITDEVPLAAKYPGDVRFNAASVNDLLICRRASTSEKILSLYGDGNIVNVGQGYAKCSTCVVGDAVITADASIAEKAGKRGIDVLLIGPGGVLLGGYDYGFIGGASGDDGERVFFCGDVSKHKNGEEIKAFCNSHGREPVSLSDDPLYDYGTLLFV